ncbi:RagB/SusD family nutrient uptake outer membrane protein [Galbibacter sp. PAP.153]|uniref:RagB/SusD family nutrient uptake outer membrane protein n=1 Tax=Galbibacter sp. PAP.153 TaxID=3104623 RepID=UPI00300BEAC7
MKKHKIHIVLTIVCLLQISCEDFVAIDTPNDRIVSEVVFNDDQTANSAVIGIYNELFRSDFSNGGIASVTMLGDLSADNLNTAYIDNVELKEFENNQILINNSYNLRIWSSAYNIIYMCNAVVDGLNRYSGVSQALKVQLIGEVQFVRAFVYFYLVNMYGEVPLVQSTDYRENATASRAAVEEVYDAIVADLESAISVLGESYEDEQYGRLRPNKFVATALLARVYLFLENWEQAEALSSIVINNSDDYGLLSNLDDVFLANSRGAIWQITPAGGGALSTVTNEAEKFILMSNPMLSSQTPVVLSPDLISSFEEGDLRLANWIGAYSTDDELFYYPYKYKKNRASEVAVTEYSMVLRLAEQYLIRAEARIHQGKLMEAIDDLDKVRGRANLELLSGSIPGIDEGALLDSINIERRRELFTEWGHRWFDLKRMGLVNNVLSPSKPSWDNTDVLYPIPEEEVNKNPYLDQNDGY